MPEKENLLGLDAAIQVLREEILRGRLNSGVKCTFVDLTDDLTIKDGKIKFTTNFPREQLECPLYNAGLTVIEEETKDGKSTITATPADPVAIVVRALEDNKLFDWEVDLIKQVFKVNDISQEGVPANEIKLGLASQTFLTVSVPPVQKPSEIEDGLGYQKIRSSRTMPEGGYRVLMVNAARDGFVDNGELAAITEACSKNGVTFFKELPDDNGYTKLTAFENDVKFSVEYIANTQTVSK